MVDNPLSPPLFQAYTFVDTVLCTCKFIYLFICFLGVLCKEDVENVTIFLNLSIVLIK